ncbi:TetR/AcrR family transcriptional regulator [Rhodococcoides yunnanense]|uniref:TetR/AcrR family transcriptional regulator n=1 Tax=Rhodococcoides yunnanense TaxID=278209 RepID=UPI000932E345|nr:TetR/AcrR family transcriptional regulator [Rhodococcus yunnanensis]
MTVQPSPATRLLDAAENLLESEGLSAVTVRSVARAAGMSHGAPRRYFPTLLGIHAAVARRGLEDLRTRIERAVGSASQPRARLRAAAVEYVRFAAERQHMFALIFRHDILADSGAQLRGTSLPLFGFVTALVEPVAGEDVHVRAVQLWTAVHGIAALNSTAALGVVTDVDAAQLVDAAIASIVGTDQPTMDFTDAGS